MTYKVSGSDEARRTVQFEKATSKNAKKIVIPDSVTLDGVTYKVTTIAPNALKGNKKVTSIGAQAFILCIGHGNVIMCSTCAECEEPGIIITMYERSQLPIYMIQTRRDWI